MLGCCVKIRQRKEQVKGVYFCNILFLFLLLVLDGRNSRELPFAVDNLEYLTIIPRAQMDSESIVHEAEGRMGY